MTKIIAAALMLLAGISMTGTATAATISLIYEFDGVEPVQTYATVEVVQNGDDLDFVIDYVGGLGNADVHELYFNLMNVEQLTGLAITTDDAPNYAYSLLGPDPSIAGGAGSSFDRGISFGNGAGPVGNGILQSASFTLSADQPLLVSYLYETSSTNNTSPVNVALHLQNTSTPSGSETVGGIVPIPAAAWLFATGLLTLTGFARRRAIG